MSQSLSLSLLLPPPLTCSEWLSLSVFSQCEKVPIWHKLSTRRLLAFLEQEEDDTDDAEVAFRLASVVHACDDSCIDTV